MFLGKGLCFHSIDKTRDPSLQGQYEDFLDSITTGGLPPNVLTLKVGCPIILLRNINPVEGLCNGTRLICRGFGEKMIYAEIAIGQFKGKETFIPRIPLESSDTHILEIVIDKTEQRPIDTRFGTSDVQEFFIINDDEGQVILATFERVPIIVAIRLGVSSYNGVSVVARDFADIILDPSYPEAQSLRNWYISLFFSIVMLLSS
ncbi:hypothetical protein BUALT_Bualt19G0034800 [Buddleja alternifolia]|uniref:DNA helicase Pif1-like 2B domain-containing protein n=1 Tax=Buddleja alternifolia TaxID=168488 RepID=A0AAV6W6T8_9LAMI|nr:hypothetical protein BUALT_Bualt19G0034800 [Buddleja alternifolia]